MDIGTFLIVGLLLTVLALAIKPIRKAVGLLIVLLGILASLTGIGLIIGIPMILIGGILLFM
jgi:F420-0:gamma-glutamyl ligase-like protein